MKLNKFFKNKINQITEAEIADLSGFEDLDISNTFAEGTTGTGATPVLSLEMQQIREQINNINSQLATRTETGPALEALKRQAYAEFLAFALGSDGVNFTKEDFAEALSITPEQAQTQYYEFDLTDVEPLGLTYTDNVTNAGANSTSNGLGIYGESILPEGMKRSWTPTAITAEDVSVPTTYGLMDAATLEKYLPADMTRRVNEVTQNTPAYSVGSTLPAGLFDAINFPEQTINRGVPVVTKGIDAQGNPTTGITMGNAAATPSGANIGQLDISTLLPSTGMGINADGSGTATVGTLDTTGNIVASSADTLNMLDTGMGNVSAVDPNVLSTAGGAAPVSTTTMVTAPGGFPAASPVGTPVGTPVVPPVGTPVVTPETPALTQAQVIQNLFNTSQTKDIAAQRIGDYAASVDGGITAEDIAAAVTPILSGQMESPNTFGMAPVGSDGAAQVMGAVQDFGYGTVGDQSFITNDALVDVAAPTYNPAEAQARLQYLATPESAIGTGDYTQREQAIRGLDFANRQGMTLGQAGEGFGLDRAGVINRAKELDIDLGSLGFDIETGVGTGFNQGGSVDTQDRSPVELRQDAVGSRLMRQTGLASLQGDTMSPEMAGTLDRIMARRK